MVAQVARQIDAEVVQRQIGDRDAAAAQVFQIDNGLLQLLELPAAVF